MRQPDLTLRSFLERLQESVAQLYDPTLPPRQIDLVCGLDVAYRGDESAAAAVLWSLSQNKPVEAKVHVATVSFPYLSTLLFMREAPSMLSALNKLGVQPHLILVDGHGIAHPRRSGLAVFIGVMSKAPTLGVAKSLLVGKTVKRKGPLAEVILEDGSTVGYFVQPRSSRRYYVSPGNRIAVSDIPGVIEFIGVEYPQPLREAHKLAKERCSRL